MQPLAIGFEREQGGFTLWRFSVNLSVLCGTGFF
jgi:hypothetical protein